MNIPKHTDSFAKELQRQGFAQNTMKVYVSNVALFLAKMTKEHPLHVNEEDLKNYLGTFTEPNSQRSAHSAIKLFTVILIITFALSINTAYATTTFSNDKPSRWCNLLSGCVDRPPSRSFIPMNTFTEEELANEEWRDIVGYENFYRVSSLGRVLSLERRRRNSWGSTSIVPEIYLRPIVFQSGYLRVTLRGKGKGRSMSIHRLVALHFIQVDEDRLQINHIDGNKKNNRVGNLEWVTAKENIRHSHLIGLRKNPLRQIVGFCKTGSNSVVFQSINEAATAVSGSRSNIHKCLIGKKKSAYGHVWSYQ